VIYLSGVMGPKIRTAMDREPDLLGLMNTPDTRYRCPSPPIQWAADNGAFGAFLRGVPFDFDRWADWLARQPRSSLFAVVPDVVEDHNGTLDLWHQWAPVVRDLGHRPAFALQNGVSSSTVPADADVLFIGGDDGFKEGPVARSTCWEYAGRCWLHMGRVNTWRRLKIAQSFRCDSVDGTCLRWPDANLRVLLSWLRRINEPVLFGGAA
jgi:hypothetical protein